MLTKNMDLDSEKENQGPKEERKSKWWVNEWVSERIEGVKKAKRKKEDSEERKENQFSDCYCKSTFHACCTLRK
jgi:hypothetical protein